MSEKQQKLLREIIQKARHQQNVSETEKSDEDYIQEVLLQRKYDKQFNINTLNNIGEKVERKLIQNLTKDEMFFCINRMKCDYLIDAIDIKRVRLYLQPINLEEISKLLKRPIHSVQDVKYSDYLTLLFAIGRFTFNRIKTFKCDSQDIIFYKDYQYESGYEQYGKIHYIKFYDLFMLDYDNHDNILEERVNMLCNEDPSLAFYLYKTFKGYHLFCVSKRIHHQSHDNILLQDRLHGDPWYANFSYNYGYKIRVSHKESQKVERISTFIKQIGNGNLDPYCLELLRIHDDMISQNLTETNDKV